MVHLYVFALLFLGVNGHSLNVGRIKWQNANQSQPTLTSLSTGATEISASRLIAILALTSGIKDISSLFQARSASSKATVDTTPTIDDSSEPAENYSAPGLARDLKGYTQGNEKDNPPGHRRPRSVLESHLSYKGVLAHNHPQPRTGGGNYPKSFGFGDYIRAGSVKRVVPQVGVMVVVDDRYRNENVREVREHAVNELEQILASSGSDEAFTSLDAHTAVIGNETDVRGPGRGDVTLFESPNTLDVMEVAADVNHASVVVAGPSLAFNDTEMTFIDVPSPATSPQSAADKRANTPNNSENVTNNTTTPREHWSTDIYRGTIVDVSRSTAATPPNRKRGDDAYDDLDNTWSSSNIVVRKLASMSSYPMFSSTAMNDDDVRMLTSGVYRGTVVDVSRYVVEASAPRVTEYRAEESRTDGVATTAAGANSSAGVVNTTSTHNNKDIKTEDLTSCIRKKPTFAGVVDSTAVLKNNTSRTVSDDNVERSNSSTTQNSDAANPNGDNSTLIIVDECESDLSSFTEVGNLEPSSRSGVTNNFTTAVNNSVGTTDLSVVESGQDTRPVTETPIAVENNNTFTNETTNVGDNADDQSETSTNSSLLDVEHPLTNFGNNSDVDIMEGSASSIHSKVLLKPLPGFKNLNSTKAGKKKGSVAGESRLPYPRLKKERARVRDGKSAGHSRMRKTDPKEWSSKVYRGTIVDVSRNDHQVRLQTRIDPIDLANVAGPPYSEFKGTLLPRTRVNKTNNA